MTSVATSEQALQGTKSGALGKKAGPLPWRPRDPAGPDGGKGSMLHGGHEDMGWAGGRGAGCS